MARLPTVVAEKSIDTGPTTMARLYTYDESARAVGQLGSAVQNIADRLQRQNEDAENFAIDQKIQQHADNLGQELQDAARNAAPGAIGLADSFTTRAIEQNKKFLDEGGVPDRLRDRVRARLDTVQTKLTNNAADAEYTQRSAWYKTEFNTNAGRLGADLANDPTNFLAAREKHFGDIDRSNLPAVEKIALKSRHGILLGDAAIDGLVKQGRKDEARDLASSLAGIGRASGEGGAVKMTDTKRASVAAITTAATEGGFPADVAVAVSILESSLDPAARAKGTARNPNPTAAGLFQFRDKERQQYGLADGADADTQARAGIRLLKDRANELQGKGIEVTPVSLYLAHFQGVGGAVALLNAEPGAKVAEVLDKATRKPGYGETVLDANRLPADIAVGAFVSRIANRVNGAMVAAQSSDVGFTEREQLVRRTETKIKQYEFDRTHEDASATRQMARSVESDIASIRDTGRGVAELSPEAVAGRLGEAKAAEWQVARERARLYYVSTRDFDRIPVQEIEARLASMAQEQQAAAGTPAYDDHTDMLERAKKKATEVLKVRETDPARAVEGEIGVQEALKALNPAMPQSVQNLVGARIAAQEAAGIPPSGTNPITNREARELSTQVDVAMALAGKDRTVAVTRLMTEVSARYGEYAEPVLTQVLRDYVKDQDGTAGKQLGGVLSLLANGQAVKPQQAQAAKEQAEISFITRAINGAAANLRAGVGSGEVKPLWTRMAEDNGKPAVPGQPAAPPPGVDPATLSPLEQHRLSPDRPKRRIEQDDWAALVTGAVEDAAFDAKYGPNAAKWLRRSVELTTNPNARAKKATQ